MTIIDTTSDTVTSQFVEADINRPTGKLTDCLAPFLSAAHCESQAPRLRDPGASRWLPCHVPRTAIHSGSSWAWIRFSARFRPADRSSSSVLLSSEREEGCGACAKPCSERFCTGSTPSSVARRSTNAAELIWPSVEIESPNRSNRTWDSCRARHHRGFWSASRRIRARGCRRDRSGRC
jgi:hypothetical protein